MNSVIESVDLLDCGHACTINSLVDDFIDTF